MDFELKELAIGIGLAVLVLLAFRLARIHRERGPYAVLLAAVASPYLMWAMETHEPDEVYHAVAAIVFVAIAVIGARWSLWIVAAGFLVHAIFAGVLHFLPVPAPTPGWYGPVCMGFNVAFAIGLAGFLAQGNKLSDMT